MTGVPPSLGPHANLGQAEAHAYVALVFRLRLVQHLS